MENLSDNLVLHQKSGAELIAAERQRQYRPQSTGGEGYNETHDDLHTDGQFADAAACYADMAASVVRGAHPEEVQELYLSGAHGLVWPWEEVDFRPGTPIQMLVKAGALIAAEIDRLQRNKAAQEPPPAVFWCRCADNCRTGMTELERRAHESSVHPGVKPRRDLDDTPPELRRTRHA